MSPVTEREIDSLERRIIRIEEKVDDLLSFRSWLLGGVAAIAAGVSTAVTLVAAWFSRP
jgi:cob(I)alamin adenosyltransferase